MSTEQIIGGLGLAGVLVGWLLRLEHRQTRCESKGEQNEKAVDSVKADVAYLRNRFDTIFPPRRLASHDDGGDY